MLHVNIFITNVKRISVLIVVAAYLIDVYLPHHIKIPKFNSPAKQAVMTNARRSMTNVVFMLKSVWCFYFRSD